jgi:hypothetical protein
MAGNHCLLQPEGERRRSLLQTGLQPRSWNSRETQPLKDTGEVSVDQERTATPSYLFSCWQPMPLTDQTYLEYRGQGRPGVRDHKSLLSTTQNTDRWKTDGYMEAGITCVLQETLCCGSHPIRITVTVWAKHHLKDPDLFQEIFGHKNIHLDSRTFLPLFISSQTVSLCPCSQKN